MLKSRKKEFTLALKEKRQYKVKQKNKEKKNKKEEKKKKEKAKDGERGYSGLPINEQEASRERANYLQS
jgi:hypothetical protein